MSNKYQDIFKKLSDNHINNKALSKIDLFILRFLTLFQIYSISAASTNMYISFDHLHKNLLNDTTNNLSELINESIKYLKEEKLLEFRSIGTVSITHSGIKEVENLIMNPQKKSTYFPDNIVNLVNIKSSDKEKITENISKRKRFIEKIAEISKGDFSKIFSLFELGPILKYSRYELENIYFYLEDEGLIKTFSLGGNFLVTHNFIKKIEEMDVENKNELDDLKLVSVSVDKLVTELIDELYYLNFISRKKLGFELFNLSAKNFNDLRISMESIKKSVHDERLLIVIVVLLEKILSDVNYTKIKAAGISEKGSINNIVKLFESKGINYDKAAISNFRLINKIRNTKAHNADFEFIEILNKLGMGFPILDWSSFANKIISILVNSIKDLGSSINKS